MILVVYVAGALVTAGMFRSVGATRGEATMLAAIWPAALGAGLWVLCNYYSRRD